MQRNNNKIATDNIGEGHAQHLRADDPTRTTIWDNAAGTTSTKNRGD